MSSLQETSASHPRRKILSPNANGKMKGSSSIFLTMMSIIRISTKSSFMNSNTSIPRSTTLVLSMNILGTETTRARTLSRREKDYTILTYFEITYHTLSIIPSCHHKPEPSTLRHSRTMWCVLELHHIVTKNRLCYHEAPDPPKPSI